MYAVRDVHRPDGALDQSPSQKTHSSGTAIRRPRWDPYRDRADLVSGAWWMVMLDPRYEQHEVATAYHLALAKYPRARVQSAMAADPPKPIDQQIADRRR